MSTAWIGDKEEPSAYELRWLLAQLRVVQKYLETLDIKHELHHAELSLVEQLADAEKKGTQ